MIVEKEFLHFHLACGLGGGAKGFNRGTARVGSMVAKFRCIGGVDVDPAGCRDFARLTGVQATCLDLFDRAQYVAFHGREPPPDWREAVPADYHRAAGGERPNVVFASLPCKGFSGLLSEKASKTVKYQALNRLTLRSIWLALEAWQDDPVDLYVFENVPRIATRGRAFLDQIVGLFRAYGYVVRETAHDCGEIGGLAQSRKRFLLVARHAEKVPNFLYEPPKRPLRGVGEVLDKLPLPLSGIGGPMHRMPALQWKTWVRLAFVEAGSDWRSLNKLRVKDGVLADFGIAPDVDWHAGVLGVDHWDEPIGVVAARSSPTNGAFSVADPRPENFPEDRGGLLGVGDWDQPAATVTSQRSPGQGRYSVADPRLDGRHHGVLGVQDWEKASGVVSGGRPTTGRFAVADPRVDGHPKSVQIGVRSWDEPAGVVTGKMFVGGGPNSVADPRLEGKPRFNNVYRIVPWEEASPAVAGPGGPAGGLAVADPRAAGEFSGKGKYRVTAFDEPSGTVIGASTTGNGGFAVADPRTGASEDSRYKNSYRVTEWNEPAGTVTTGHSPSNGGQAVADPRLEAFGGGSGVVGWDESSGAIAGESLPSNGKFSVADPRYDWQSAHENKMAVRSWDGPAKTVTGSDRVGSGAQSVADPRPVCLKPDREAYRTGGHYGVVPWDAPRGAISAHPKNNNGMNSVADPRVGDDEPGAEEPAPRDLPAPGDRLVCVIRALDGTWHRPFTTLELAALQSLVDPEEFLELDGLSDAAWRERIGNAVPPDAAEAIASVMGRCLLLAMTGETFALSSEPVWVQPIVVAMMTRQPEDPC